MADADPPTQPTLRDLLDERHKAHQEEHRIHEVAHAREHAATEQAIATATTTLDKRLDGMNEFRDQLRDQAATFVRTDAFDVFKSERRQALSTIETTLDRRFDELRAMIGTEREERRDQYNLRVGEKQGISMTTGAIVGAIGLAATIISVVVVVANVLA